MILLMKMGNWSRYFKKIVDFFWVVYYSSIDDLKAKIIPHTHGVILKKGSYQATFLPQVWEQLPQFETFFDYLCQKARLQSDCLRSHPEIFTYQVEEYRE